MPGLPLASIGELLDILPDAVVMIDDRSCIVYANPALRTLLGYQSAELEGQALDCLLPAGVRVRHAEQVARFRRHGTAQMMGQRPVLSAQHRSGRLVPVSISICNLPLGDGRRVSVAVLHDVSTLHTHLDRATEQAETDPLTGVGNRLRLSRRLQALLEGEHRFALLYMDLQRFKPFNDEHGHAAGDEALRIVARRLQAQVRDADIVVRHGGDEFVVLLDGLYDEAHLWQRAQAIQQSLTRPLRIARADGALGVTIGGVICPRHGNSAQALLAAADQAMYQARRSGQGYQLAPG